MMLKRIAAAALTILLAASCAIGQESQVADNRQDVHQARLIKVTRMSAAWYGQNMDLLLTGDGKASGRMVGLNGGSFHLQGRDGIREVPVSAVATVVLKRKPSDLTFVAFTACGMAGLFAGGASLGSDASPRNMAVAGGVGGALGFFLGWKAFYQDTVIPLE